MTTRHPFKLPDKMPKGDYEVSCETEEWPINDHPSLRYTKRNARKVRRLRQLYKSKYWLKTILVPVYTITKHP